MSFADSLITDKMGKQVYKLMLELARIESVTGSAGGEEKCARFIYDRLSLAPYFKEHADDLCLVPLKNDPFKRHAVAAFLRSKKRGVRKTVILTGHFDVVDAQGCGPLATCAFDPEEYTRRAHELSLPDEAKRDLESGSYLFGRGVSDMKTGVALDICLIEDYAERREDLEFNVLLLLVPDEEGDSYGMRGSVSYLADLRARENLDYLVAIDTEPSFEDGKIGIYYGTIGKIMPFCLCVGIESHTGNYKSGLNSTLIASYLNLELEGKGDKPQCCLYMKDLRENYAVTLPERTVVYYNRPTVSDTPELVLRDIASASEAALAGALKQVGRHDLLKLPKKIVYAEDIIGRASKLAGSREKLFAELLPKIESSDERERNIKFVSLALDLLGEKGPLVIVGFLPPYYPQRRNTSESDAERGVREAARCVRGKLKELGFGLEEVEIFEGITDMSFTGFSESTEELKTLAQNMPLWGHNFDLPISDLKKIDVPCAIFGPLGKDAHKATERIDVNYSFNILPNVMKDFIASIQNSSR
ncbi:hypothetical protein FACS1894187_17800 [Synergistales bacterium]|nr:hypothetical protein FACS1894187_17800 [Synergistales bacterium]